MKRIAIFGFLCLLAGSGIAATMAVEEAGPGEANVELLVRGPDGKPLANAPIVITHYDHVGAGHAPALIEVTTDANGVARFAHNEGVFSLSVTAAGVGYGTIGITEFIAGKLARPHLPALAPYGSIAGILPEGQRYEYERIGASREYVPNEPHTTASDAEGCFKLTDLPAGLYWLYEGDRRYRLADGGHLLTLYPGQKLEGATLKAIADTKRGPGLGIQAAPAPKSMVWVAGTVRDDAGKPIAGATVYIFAVFNGGMRMYDDTLKATTDEKGYYEFKGAGGLGNFKATVVAVVSGKPAAWGWPDFPNQRVVMVPIGSATEPAKIPEHPIQDLVIPARGCSMEVTALIAGKPAAGAQVRMYLENANLKDEWAAGGSEAKLWEGVENAAYPLAITDEKGVARFTNLLPGRYRIIAVKTMPTDGDPGEQMRSDVAVIGQVADGDFRNLVKSHYAIAEGIPVSLTKAGDFRMVLYPQRNLARMRILRDDGDPLSGNESISYGPVQRNAWTTGISLDQSGAGQLHFQSPGLWHVEVTYRGTPVASLPVGEPHFSAIATVAASPNLDPAAIPTITAQFMAPPSARIEVKDAAGKPLSAVVTLERPLNLAKYAGSTDAAGSILFTGIVGWDDYVVGAFAAGMEPADLGHGDAPLPASEKLTHRTELIAQRLSVERNVESHMIFAPEAAGYVRGVVHFPKGAAPAGYQLYVDASTPVSGAEIHFQPATGEYVAGPFRHGPVEFVLTVPTAEGGESQVKFSTRARGGELVKFDMTAPATPAGLTHTTGGMLYVDAGGASMPTGGAARIVDRVVLADGKTPALGAQIFYFEPGEARPTVLAITDALGVGHGRSFSRDMNATPPGVQIGPPTAMAVALLPGSCGATVVSLADPKARPLRFVLPAAIGVTGQITVGGVAPSKRVGSIRVLAAYQGKGFLDRALSLETTADVEGKFQLDGLTPGTYHVQAALDGIWLSETATLEVKDGALKPLTLDIGAPGSPVVVTVKDAAGNSAVGCALTLDRPPGPLTDLLWPAVWRTDGAGCVSIPTLEVGKHTIRVKDSAVAKTFEVGSVPADKSEAAELRLGK